MVLVRTKMQGESVKRVGRPKESPDLVKLRLIEALGESIVDRGYAATTIADVVACAQTSKRTFYEFFADKEECFLAAYSTVSDQLIETIAAAASPSFSWRQQVQAA